MTKRIFRSIFLGAMGVFVASVLLFLFVLYDYFGGVQRSQLRTETTLAAHAVANEGMDFFEDLDTARYRITWIGKDGTVLYDSRSDQEYMENHLEREEVQEALAKGQGESSRYSITLMERSLYCANRLPDGSVIRLSVSQNTLLTLLLGMIQPIFCILLIAVVLSLMLASRLSRRIVRPLNDLDLERPLENEGYDELIPLLLRLDSQQRQIRLQKDELERRQREFDAITDNMTEGILLLNPKGNILSINRAARKLFQVDGRCVGEPLLSVGSGPELAGLLVSASAGRYDEKILHLDGRVWQLILNPVHDGGSVSGCVLLALDITEKELAEQMRREFTANVSHELKTPLHTIAGSAELLEEGIVREEDRGEFYRRIRTEAQRMIRLVEDIIHLSRLDEGATDMKREKTDLLLVAEETVQSLKAEAERAGVSLKLSGDSALIQGIPQLLRSIVFNLCDNAIRYNRRGGSVDVTVRNGADGVVLKVADTGIGIPAEHRERIFERFYRVDKSRSKELGGTGLGLSIVKHAARLHNARISLQSEVNSGTTITISFPQEATVAMAPQTMPIAS